MEQITEEMVLTYLENCPLEDALSVMAIGQGILRMRQKHQPARRSRSDKGQPREPQQPKFIDAKTGKLEPLEVPIGGAVDMNLDIVTEGYGGVQDAPDWVQPKKPEEKYKGSN